MSIWAELVLAFLIFLAGAAGGVKWEKGQQALRNVAAQEQAREDRAMRERSIDAAAVSHEADKREIRTEYLVITERVEDAKQTDFYAAGAPLCLDDAGVRIVNDAARGATGAASQPARAVSEPAGAARRPAGDGS